MELKNINIIGAGASGLFAAYEIKKTAGDKFNIRVFEQGESIYDRRCPIVEKMTKKCINCRPCAIMSGFGGAGAFSDGKYNITTQYGGWITDYMDEKSATELMEYVDEVIIKLSEEEIEGIYEPKSIYKKEALKYDLHLLQGRVRHLGTEKNLSILKSMYEYLKEEGVEFLFKTKIERVSVHQSDYKHKFSVQSMDETFESDILIIAVGRSGAEWFSKQCKDGLGLRLINNQVDVGVRVEVPSEILEDITGEIYEAKIKYRTKAYSDVVRTFCMNPNGYVVTENTDGIITVNGHSFSNKSLGSRNTNFALLVSNKFTEPFDDPYAYGKRIASFSNLLGGGVLVQRFGDLVKGRRTNAHRLSQSFTKPTLDATPGDLSLVLPKRQLDDIIEMIYQLDKMFPGLANENTLLYGVEVKFYSSRLELTDELETSIEGMYAIGDGSGTTRSLSQASASGVHVARIIGKKG
ncbi:NAD(P)/FAD-dependent oxidoreductase [Peptoclostridium litorale]|uniref:NAD(P)/FAD-dependent oxidoreductase n=1 Tax=Peptoclostridium litorale TaxID=1557 RepID=UPI00056FB636|nr:NAD(P)/FAD-dependent oxidoreductase [Peptoclostridium litorale]